MLYQFEATAERMKHMSEPVNQPPYRASLWPYDGSPMRIIDLQTMAEVVLWVQEAENIGDFLVECFPQPRNPQP